LTNVDLSSSPIAASCGCFFMVVTRKKWRNVCHSLRIEICYELDKQAFGDWMHWAINTVAELQRLVLLFFQDGSDSAVMEFLGVAGYSSSGWGLWILSNPGLVISPCGPTIVDKLVSIQDPRPKNVGCCPWLGNGTILLREPKPLDYVNIYGGASRLTRSFILFAKAIHCQIDYSLYVWITSSLAVVMRLDNIKEVMYTQFFLQKEAHIISFLHGRYREECGGLRKSADYDV